MRFRSRCWHCQWQPLHAVDAQSANSNGGPKVLRYAFRVAETGFDPAQVNDFYSSSINGNIFDAPLAYDFLAQPTKIVLNTAEAMPETFHDFTTITVRIRPGIYFRITRRSRAKSAS